MILFRLIFGIIAVGCTAVGQATSGTAFKLALADHKGQLSWSAEEFKIIQSSAKPNGREMGVRAQNRSGQLTFIGYLFLVPESAPLTSVKCRDGALNQEKKGNPNLKILRTSEITRPDGLPVSLVTYTSRSSDGSTGYTVRGFVATGDVCGDLAFYAHKPITPEDADLKSIFSGYQLDPNYAPKFADVVVYAQILYQARMYEAAAPTFEKALALLTEDGSPFPSARIASRVVTDQAGMAYGIAGELGKARRVFESGIAKDPEYALYYYNLACTDAGEKKLADARLHLQQAFARKANLNSGETMPDPTKDDSFTPYRANEDFWIFVQNLQAGK